MFSVPNDKHIGVMLSGGMDSALLLFLIAQQHPQKITTFTVPKHDGASLYVDGIVDWINQKLQVCIPYSMRVGNPNLHHEKILVNAMSMVRNECDVFYLAGNAYPEDILPGGPRRIRATSNTVKQPFFDYYKTDIVRAYMNHNIMDLLPYTHTCTEWSVGRCQQCWQCKERIWAFSALGIEDLTNT